MRPAKLIVAFETQMVPGLPAPTFTPPSNYKDQDKINAWLEGRQSKYETDAANQPYTGTFKRLVIADPANKRVGNWTYRKPDSGKQPVCLAARSWLLKEYGDAWEHTTHPGHSAPDVIFIGFRTKLFLKMLGIECSLPEHQPQGSKELNVLPLSMWYGNTDHRDLENAAMPSDYELSWDQVLTIRDIGQRGWTGPGSNAKAELDIASDLAAQLGMLSEHYAEE
jgi:hypothetical protein